MADPIAEAPSLSLPLPLPPGFKFKPSEQELLSHYLKNKIHHQPPPPLPDVIQEIDLSAHDPADLPETACFASASDPAKRRWYFFVPRQRERRLRRRAWSGSWKRKRRGNAAVVYGNRGEVLGMKKTFRFYRGRSPLAVKTNWIMKEYELIDADSLSAPRKDYFVLCCVFPKSRAKRKLLNQESCSSDENNQDATFNNDNDNPFELHDRALISGNGEVVANEGTSVGVGDEVPRLLMELFYEPDNTVSPEPVCNALFPERIQQSDHPVGISDEFADEMTDQVMLEGDFIELNDLLSPVINMY